MSPTAKRKREYGTGSVYYRKSDNLWIGSVVVGWTERGTLRRRVVSGKTETEARQKLDALRKKIDREGDTATGSARTTVKAWSDRYLELDRAKNSPNAHTTNKGIVRKWIVPTIGTKRLAELTPADVRAVTQAQRSAGAALSSLGRTHAVLRRMLKVAVAEGYDVPQRAIATEPPKTGGKSDRIAVPIPQMNALIDAASTHMDGARWWIALTMGLRQGEALGLRWSLVDLDDAVIDVSWQLDSLPYVDRHDKAKGFLVPDDHEAIHLEGARHLVRPKTEAGQRFIYLEPVDVEILRRWREHAPDSPHDLVFPRPDGGPRRDVADTAEWKALQVEAGVVGPGGRPYKLHEARHATATMLLEAGVDQHTVTSMMGHTSIATSRGYQTVSPELSRRGRREGLKALGR